MPVDHIVTYYDHLIRTMQPKPLKASWLWQWKQHYLLLLSRVC